MAQVDELIGIDPDLIPEAVARLINGQWKNDCIPQKWDGMAVERIVSVLAKKFT